MKTVSKRPGLIKICGCADPVLKERKVTKGYKKDPPPFFLVRVSEVYNQILQENNCYFGRGEGAVDKRIFGQSGGLVFGSLTLPRVQLWPCMPAILVLEVGAC